MTREISVKELNEIKNESYDKWFERWYEKENLPKKLEQVAMKGYTAISYTVADPYTDYEQRRLRDIRFINSLEDKLEGFKIYREEPRKKDLGFLGRKIGTVWTELKIVISWEEST